MNSKKKKKKLEWKNLIRLIQSEEIVTFGWLGADQVDSCMRQRQAFGGAGDLQTYAPAGIWRSAVEVGFVDLQNTRWKRNA